MYMNGIVRIFALRLLKNYISIDAGICLPIFKCETVAIQGAERALRCEKRAMGNLDVGRGRHIRRAQMRSASL